LSLFYLLFCGISPTFSFFFLSFFLFFFS